MVCACRNHWMFVMNAIYFFNLSFSYDDCCCLLVSQRKTVSSQYTSATACALFHPQRWATSGVRVRCWLQPGARAFLSLAIKYGSTPSLQSEQLIPCLVVCMCLVNIHRVPECSEVHMKWSNISASILDSNEIPIHPRFRTLATRWD